MIVLLPSAWWPPALLLLVVAFDIAISVRPTRVVRDCLTGVGFPREWWWTLIAIKALAAAGLLIGLWVPGIGFAANVGVIAYFCCAAYSHIRAGFTGRSFWFNCLGMLALSLAVLALSYA